MKPAAALNHSAILDRQRRTGSRDPVRGNTALDSSDHHSASSSLSVSSRSRQGRAAARVAAGMNSVASSPPLPDVQDAALLKHIFMWGGDEPSLCALRKVRNGTAPCQHTCACTRRSPARCSVAVKHAAESALGRSFLPPGRPPSGPSPCCHVQAMGPCLGGGSARQS